MQSPSSLRSLLGTLPFGVNIDGRAEMSALRTPDALFHPRGESAVVVGKDVFTVDTSNPDVRAFYYVPHNLIRFARRSAFFGVMQRVLRGRKGTSADVGANLGLYSYLASKLGARTMLFVPEPAHYAFLHAMPTFSATSSPMPSATSIARRPSTSETCAMPVPAPSSCLKPVGRDLRISRLWRFRL